jgi:hypothetical protein
MYRSISRWTAVDAMGLSSAAGALGPRPREKDSTTPRAPQGPDAASNTMLGVRPGIPTPAPGLAGAAGPQTFGPRPEFGFRLEAMEPRIRRALETERTIDITTVGRTSGRPRRIEMWFHNLDGRLYLTGTPGTRDWYANLAAHPTFTFHLKGAVRADLPARATPVVEPAARRAVLAPLLARLGHAADLDRWVRESPLVLVEILETPPGG